MANQKAAPAATDTSTTEPTGIRSATPPPGSRRIVKAKKKAPGESLTTASSPDETANNDTSREEEPRMDHVPHPIADTEPVARELGQERAEQVKQDLLQTASERQRLKREKELAERRSAMETHRKESFTLNPMSRFLSVFSVQPEHPEHKRPLPEDGDTSHELSEPVEKRPRPSAEEEQADTTAATSTTDEPTLISVPLLLMASAVGLTAVAFAIWQRRRA